MAEVIFTSRSATQEDLDNWGEFEVYFPIVSKQSTGDTSTTPPAQPETPTSEELDAEQGPTKA